jgi:chromosome segregation protein
MLKSLELIGFKSFADKTDFNFPLGITAIVGPNGSGKSNIVDAIRWVLGEQSARSLRGGEMTDVIFNGSASRKGNGLAEVSLLFDNTKKIFQTESTEVQVTRRVYRNGDSEYLINRKVCRLKDIKDLFMGSGAGSDAYCIIEQGKVDGLLQSSPKERRIIFDEAAGISRFKIKKLESLRRLERVDQNVERLKDILEEVERQLKTVRLQATKAQKWQEYSDRLKELRLNLGLQEYSQLTENLESEYAKLSALRNDLEQGLSETDELEKKAREKESFVTQLDEQIRSGDLLISEARQNIAAGDSSKKSDRESLETSERDLVLARKSLMDHNKRLALLDSQLDSLRQEAELAESNCTASKEIVEILEKAEKEASEEDSSLRISVIKSKEEHLENMRLLARLQNSLTGSRAKLESYHREAERLRQRNENTVGSLAVLDAELGELTIADEILQIRLAAARTTLLDLGKEKEALELAREQFARELSEFQANRSGTVSRLEVLEGLEKSLEGFGVGLKEILELSKDPSSLLWNTILGVVADFIEVSSEFAALIDLALGEKSQRILVQDQESLIKALASHSDAFSSRVSFQGFLQHNMPAPYSSETAIMLEGQPEIVGWAHEFVKCNNPDFPNLPQWLLGQTLIVKSMDFARTFSASNPSIRILTLLGEILEPDGTLTMGTHHAETGILSRKAELRELKNTLLQIEDSIALAQSSLDETKNAISLADTRIENQRRDIDILSEQLSDLRARIERQKQRKDGMDEELKVSGNELRNLDDDTEKETKELEVFKNQAEQLEEICLSMEQTVKVGEERLRDIELQRRARTEKTTIARVAFAQAKERADAFKTRFNSANDELAGRKIEQNRTLVQINEIKLRSDTLNLSILNVTSQLAMWFLKKDQAEDKARFLHLEKAKAVKEKETFASKAYSDRSAWRNKQELVHGRELAVNDLQVRRDTLCTRMSDDYEINLGELYLQRKNPAEGTDQGTVMPAIETTVIADEITELRNKIHRLGNVNIESLEELTNLEFRHSSLKIQYDDLVAGKKALEEIISKINADSRSLFIETFQNVRTHFQDLFRKLFGGGMADVILEDEQDVLECGIEIKAKPPGKELRSISLMSGGEKTMTAVALLLAIFRNKPSPFCLLDEVDAALDEANVNRFTNVLRDFMDKSQFILITHSKRTMACADVLYGITMQESGISRRMAIRFQDWPADEKKEAPSA